MRLIELIFQRTLYIEVRLLHSVYPLLYYDTIFLSKIVIYLIKMIIYFLKLLHI